MIDPREALGAWDVSARELHRPERGTNNLTWLVDDRYVLRVYQNLDASRVAAEHRLLEALRAQDLPFDVPDPISTPDGASFVQTPDGPAALYTFLPGRPGDARDLEPVARALAELMIALGRLPSDVAPTDWRIPLSGTHPAVPDVGELVEELRVLAPDAPGLERFATNWQRADTDYRTTELPVQICHLDFAPGNALLDGGRVTAVLDFEVAGLDIRVNDFVAGLVQSTDTEAEQRTFTRAFRERLDLTEAEWDAVPRLCLLRQIATVVWRAGRWREGKASLDDVLERLRALQNPYTPDTRAFP